MPRAKIKTPPGSLNGGFIVPPQGRPSKGSLPGESKEGRDQRVLAYIQANPSQDNDQVVRAMRVPLGVVQAMRHQGKLLAKERAAQAARGARFAPPPQLFTPSAPPPPTPQERIAALSGDERERIAAQYGATFKR